MLKTIPFSGAADSSLFIAGPDLLSVIVPIATIKKT